MIGQVRNANRRTSGFSLIELLVVVLVVSILAAVAYPSYLESSRKARRNDAKISLMDLASRMERYYTENNTYATATIAAGNPATDVLSSAFSADNHYTLSITGQNATAFALRATPVAGGLQAGDGNCGNFDLASTGLQSVSGTKSAAYCW